jgi:Ca2+-binding RTX toxin-like protein
MLFVGLMGMLAVGATAFYGFDTFVDDPEAEEANGALKPGETSETTDSTQMDISALDADGGKIVEGTDQVDTLTGGENPDQINGYGDDDQIDGLEGRDDLHGEAGQDTLIGSEGEDTLHGGDGDDLLTGGAGADTLFGGNHDDVLGGGTGDDSLVGSNGNDTLNGGTGADAVHGELGDDNLAGGAGQDTLFGSYGNDILNGTDDLDADYLNGGAGEDTIIAGDGDMVSTGDGADIVSLNARLANDHEPLITDFSAEEDSLAVIYDDLADPDPEVTIEDHPDKGGRQSVLLNGTVVASLDNAPDLGLSNITLIPQSTL